MLDLWTDLSKKKAAGTISKKELALYNKWGKAMRLLSKDPSYPSLHTHDIEPLTKRYGVKVWQSYLENNTSRAMRMYWVYGPDRQTAPISQMHFKCLFILSMTSIIQSNCSAHWLLSSNFTSFFSMPIRLALRCGSSRQFKDKPASCSRPPLIYSCTQHLADRFTNKQVC